MGVHLSCEDLVSGHALMRVRVVVASLRNEVTAEQRTMTWFESLDPQRANRGEKQRRKPPGEKM